jgi:cardiolipin synthase
MRREGEARIWTVPNMLSFLRFPGLGLFCYLLLGPGERVAAAAVLAVTGTTDFFDGMIARRFNQVTSLGKVLDPTADRVVVTTSTIALLVYGAIPAWVAAVVLTREVLVSTIVLLLAALGAERMGVVWPGKAAAFGLMFCLPLFLATDGPGTFAHVIRDVTWVLLVPSLAFSLSSMVAYVPRARRRLAERQGRRQAADPAGSGAPRFPG